MPPLDSRQIKRPRLSLSCIVCRRRKVRCGREQPECANCVRMKEHCVYKSMVRDDFPGGPDSQFKNRQVDLTWSHWVSRDIDNAAQPSPPVAAITPAASASALSATSAPAPPCATAPTPVTTPAARPRLTPHSETGSLSHQNNQQVDLAYLTVPSWEEAIQQPDDHELSAGEARSNILNATQDASEATRPEPTPYACTNRESICSDYLSLRRGARARYIGPAFWGFATGKESLSDDFFDESRNADPDLPLAHISSMSMFNLLRSLPTKPVSDALLEAFFMAVWPLSPLVHCPTLRADYNDFWVWCRSSDTALPSEKLRDDPTFICLLFAVLYCGASSAPVTSWMSAGLQGLRKETTVNHLKSAYMTSLSLCQHLEHPTLNTLVSTLLAGPFLDRLCEPLRNLVSVSTTVRLAQSMGLHRDGTCWSALSPVDQEIRRRAWWHIIWLDVQSSISTGLPPCCGSEALDAVSMIADTRDEDIDGLSTCLPPCPDPVAPEQSIAIIFAIGRSETARLQSKIVARLQSGRRLGQNGFAEFFPAVKELQQKIDALIARIPLQGIPERGFIPSRLANASPSTHPSLYKDHATQPTVLAAWTRIMLTLLKSDIAILLQKPLLPPPDSSNPHSCKTWTSMSQLCVSYLRIVLQLYQAPAFSPYGWFCCSYYGPLQCAFLTLVYLHCFKDSGEILLARYCVDEIIDHSVAHYQVPTTPSARGSPEYSDSAPRTPGTQIPLALQVLVDLHSRLDLHLGPDSNPSLPADEIECLLRPSASNLVTAKKSSAIRKPSCPSSSSSTSNPKFTASTTNAAPPTDASSTLGPRGGVFAAESDSGLDMDLLASISDLESWSSPLVMESNDILAHSDLLPSDYSAMGFGPFV